MNVLYVGLENPVSISVSGKIYDKLNVNISGGTIVETGNGLFKVTVSDDLVGKQVNIDVTITTNGIVQPVGSYPFRVMGIPKPESIIEGWNHSKSDFGYTIPVKDLKDLADNCKLGVCLGGVVYEGLDFTIISYTITLSGSAKSINVKGNTFTEDVKALINSTKSGGLLFFDNIKATGIGKTWMLAPIQVKIEK